MSGAGSGCMWLVRTVLAGWCRRGTGMGQPRAWARPVRVFGRRRGTGYHAARPGVRWPAGDGGLAAVTGDLAAVGPGGPPAVQGAFVRIWSWAVRPVALTTVPAASPPARAAAAAAARGPGCGIPVMG